MEFESKTSRFIRKVEYFPDLKEMAVTIERRGEETRYVCSNVPQFVYEDFERAPSRGIYFNRNVKGRFVHEIFRGEKPSKP